MKILERLKKFFIRHKRKIIRYSGITLIVAGLLVILFPIYTNFIMAGREDSVLAAWEEGVAYVQGADDLEDGQVLERDIEVIDPEMKLPFQISIPEIDLSWLVNEGTDYVTLRKGPGFYIGSAFPGETGTCVVAGHRTTYGAPFNRLDELEEEDEIFIETFGNEKFTYIVTGQESVYPDDLSVLENTDYPSLVLSTCAPKYFATRRLIIFADIKEIPKLKTAEDQTQTEVIPEDSQAEEAPSVENISVGEVYEIMTGSGDYIILDVRTLEEFGQGHLEGAAHIPVNELEGRLSELSKERPIIVYCKSGGRSSTAANLLIEKGYTRIYNMSGGITEWMSENYPIVIEGQEAVEEYEVMEISVDEAYKFYNDGGYFFLDVRSESEYESGHIKGAVNIPYSQLEDRLAELPTDTPIIAYFSGSSCNKSGVASRTLADNGFTQIYDVGGIGIVEWEQKGYPMEN
jgi:LPXTG-site transpeptidase (sortase) family protein